jgi:soluble lytic murein transglycosylase
MMAESGGNPNAVSPKGAMGRFQVMPDTARDPGFGIKPWRGGQDDLDRVGRDYRQTMHNRYGGDLSKMWGAYNWGPGNVDRATSQYGDNWLQYAPAETQNYVRNNLRRARGR